MLRSMYTAATAMTANARRFDVITNNVTNVETKGYKADTLVTKSFRDMLITRINDPSVYVYNNVGPHNLGVHIDYTSTSFAQGGLEETGVSTDLALDGDGFFVVEYIPMTLIPPTAEDLLDEDYTPEYEEGEPEYRYTRGGTFAVDADGYLVTPDGYFVQGQSGSIYVGSTDFTVNANGEILVDGEVEEQLRLVRFSDNQLLRKAGDNLYTVIYPDENEPEDVTIEVRQGFLENSNVDLAREMVSMIEVQRHYEINQRVLRMLDDSLGRAVNDIARF